jgi:hypothetical protein
MTTPNPPGYPWQKGQIPTAESLNAQFAKCLTTPSQTLPTNSILLSDGSGSITSISSLGVPGQVLTSAGSSMPPTWANASIYDPSSVAITGGTINNTAIGGSTPSAGSFTNVNTSGSVASSSTITGTRLISTIATGTAPLVVTSTTPVANLTTEFSSNLTGGTSGSIPYQTSGSTTGMLPIGSNGTTLTVSGGALTWVAGGTYDPTNVGITGGTINNTSIGATTKSSGGFTTIVATGTITPNTVAGIVGTTVGDNAQAGSVGEIATITQTVVAGVLSSNAINNIVQLPISAGCWLATGSIKFFTTTGATITTAAAGLTLTTSTLPSVPLLAGSDGLNVAYPGSITFTVPDQIFNVTGTGNFIWMTAFPIFTGGAGVVGATGQITAIRIR